MKWIYAWFKASRLLSFPYIVLPLILGQSLAFSTGHFSYSLLILSCIFGLCYQLYIVYANDYADVELDALNKEYSLYSGGSRVVPEKLLPPRALGIAAIIMVILMFITSLYLIFVNKRYFSPLFVFIAVILLWLYSYKPVKLSYRGFGELLQALGLGINLILFGYYLQKGDLFGFDWLILPGIFLLNYGIAGVTALPDYKGDLQGKRNTLPVMWGRRGAVAIILVLIGLGIVYFGFYTIILKCMEYALIFLLIPLLMLIFCLFLLKNIFTNRKLLIIFGLILIMIKGYIYVYLSVLVFSGLI